MSIFINVQKSIYDHKLKIDTDLRDLFHAILDEHQEQINGLKNKIENIEYLENELVTLEAKASLSEKEQIQIREITDKLIGYNNAVIEEKKKQGVPLTADETQLETLNEQLNKTSENINQLLVLTRNVALTNKTTFQNNPFANDSAEKKLFEKIKDYKQQPWFDYLRAIVFKKMCNDSTQRIDHPYLISDSIFTRYIQGDKPLILTSSEKTFISGFFQNLSTAIDGYLSEEKELINSYGNDTSITEYISQTFNIEPDEKATEDFKEKIKLKFNLGDDDESDKLIKHYFNTIIFGEHYNKNEKQAKINARIALENAYVYLATNSDYDRHTEDKFSRTLKNYPHIQHPHTELLKRIYNAEYIKLNGSVYNKSPLIINDFLKPENIATLIKKADTNVIEKLTAVNDSNKSGVLHDFNIKLKRIYNKAATNLNISYHKLRKYLTKDYDFYQSINQTKNNHTGIVPKYADRANPSLAKLSKKSLLDDKALYTISSLAYAEIVGKNMPEQQTNDFYEHIRYLSEENKEKWQALFDQYITRYRSGLEISLHTDAKKPNSDTAPTGNMTAEGDPEVYKTARIIIAKAYLKLAEQGYDRDEAFEIEQSLHQTWRFSLSSKPIQHGLNKEEKITREFRNTRHTLRLYEAIKFLKISTDISLSKFQSNPEGLALFFTQLTPAELKKLGVTSRDEYDQKVKFSREITTHYDKYLLREHNANIKHLEGIRKNREKSLTNIGQNASLSAGIGTALNTLAIVTGGLLGMATLGWPFVGTLLAFAAVWAITNPIIDYIWPTIEKKNYFNNSLTGEFDLLASDKWKKTAKTGLMLFFTLAVTSISLIILAAIGFAAWWIPFIALAGLVIYASSKFMNINFFRKMTQTMILKFAKMDNFYRFKLYLGFVKEFNLSNTQKNILMVSVLGNVIMGILYASLTYLRLNTFISDNIKEFLKNHILGPNLYNAIADFKFESDDYPVLADIGNFFVNSSIGIFILIPQLIVAGFALCIFVGYALLTTTPVAEFIVFITKAWKNPDEYFTWVKLTKTFNAFTNGIENTWNKATEYKAYKTADKKNAWTILGAALTLTIAPIIFAAFYYALVCAYRYLNGAKLDKYNLLTFTGFFNFVADYAIRKPILHPLKALSNFIGGIILGCLPFVSAAGAIALLSVSADSFAGILEEDVNLTAKEADNTSKIFLLFSIMVKTPLVVYSAFDAVAGLSSDKKVNPHKNTLDKKVKELEEIFMNNMNITPGNKDHTIKLRDFIKKYNELSTSAAYAAKFNALESMFKIFVNAALQSELAIYDKDDPTAYLDYQTFRDYLFGGGAFAQSLSLGMMSRLGYQGSEAAELVKRIARAFRKTHIRLINDYCENNPTEAQNMERRKQINKHFLNIDENGNANFTDIPNNIMQIIIKERAEKRLRKEAREQLETYVSKMEKSYIPSTREQGYLLRNELSALLKDSSYSITNTCDDIYFKSLATQYKNVADTQKNAFVEEYKENNLSSTEDRSATTVNDMNDDKVLTVLNERRFKATRHELQKHIEDKTLSKITRSSEKGNALKADFNTNNELQENQMIDNHVGIWALADYWNQFCEVDAQKVSKPDTTTRVLLNRYNNAKEEYQTSGQNCAVKRELRG
ncbi:MAG: hypothetical protein WC748_04115 [Legionellales bacterium]|jgi:hypothetical protein